MVSAILVIFRCGVFDPCSSSCLLMFCGAEVNAKEMISGGALWELVRISKECSREDIRSLAHRTLSSSPVFRSEIRRLGIQF